MAFIPYGNRGSGTSSYGTRLWKGNWFTTRDAALASPNSWFQFLIDSIRDGLFELILLTRVGEVKARARSQSWLSLKSNRRATIVAVSRPPNNRSLSTPQGCFYQVIQSSRLDQHPTNKQQKAVDFFPLGTELLSRESSEPTSGKLNSFIKISLVIWTPSNGTGFDSKTERITTVYSLVLDWRTGST